MTQTDGLILELKDVHTFYGAIQALLDQKIVTGKEAYQKGINKAKLEALKDQE